MKILLLLHGTPPQAGRTVVGSGLRAFANGQALRHLGHEVVYCTRTEDLPEDLRPAAGQRRRLSAPGVEAFTSTKAPAGDPARMPKRDELDTDPAIRSLPGPPGAPLATSGGPLGTAGNPFSFTETHELHAVVRGVDPDVVLVEAPEEARRLPDGRFGVVLDMFAPRILEQQFQDGGDEREAVRVLDSLQRGDHFIFSNERQKYYHLPLLALAGVDCTEDAGGVVPISCPPELPAFRKPDEPVFVAGGVFWPWADLTGGLVDLLEVLKEAGEGQIHLYGGEYGIRSDTTRYADPRSRLPQDDPQLVFKGLVPIDTLWQDYASASVAFDLMAPNPEREINLSFRQVDYLRCGLPLVTSPRQVIAADVAEYGAGWCIDPSDRDALASLVRRLLAEPDEIARASSAAQRLAAERYAWTQTAGALEAWLERPQRRRNRDGFVARLARTQADLWEDHQENRRLRESLGHHREDLEKKSVEVERLNARVGTLMGTVDRLTDSLSDVSSFKNEAITYLQESEDAALRDAAELGRELERRALDLHKKQQALEKATREVDKLKASIQELQADNESLQARFAGRDAEAMELGQQRDLLRDRLGRTNAELATARTEVASKALLVEEAARERDRLQREFQSRLERAQASAGQVLEDVRDQLAVAVSERGTLRAKLEETEHRLRERERQAEAARTGFTSRIRTAEEAGERAERERQELVLEAERERDRLQREFITRLERAEGSARQLLEDARDRLATVLAERGEVSARLDETEHRLRETERQLKGVRAELGARNRAAEEAYNQFERDRRVITDEAEETVRLARGAADEARLERDELHKQLVEKKAAIDGLKLDISKKTKALLDAHTERADREADHERRIQELWAQANKKIAEIQDEADDLKDDVLRAQERVKDLEATGKKQARLINEGELERQRQRKDFLRDVEEAETTAQRALDDFKERTEQRLRDIWVSAQREADKARKERDVKGVELAGARKRIDDLEADIVGKDAALLEAEAQREALQLEVERRVQDVWHAARKEIEKIEGGRESAEDALLKARFVARDLEKQVADRQAELADQRRAWEEREAEFQGLLDAAAAEAEERLDRLRQDILAHRRAWDDREVEFQRALDAAETAAAERLEGFKTQTAMRLAELKAAQERALAEAERLRERDRLRISDEAEQRIAVARSQSVEARVQRDRAREELVLLQSLAEDLQADVEKKTHAIEQATLERERLQEQFLANLERAEGTASTLLEDARDRIETLAGERARLSSFVQELESREQDLARGLRSKDALLELAEQKVRAERAGFEELLIELQLVRDQSSASADRLNELEAEAQRRRAAVEAMGSELAATTGRLEEAEFELQALQDEAVKKSAELEKTQAQRDSIRHELEQTRERQAAEREQAAERTGDLEGELEQASFELQELADVRQRVGELEARLEQADHQLAELAPQQEELGRLTGRLEEADYEMESLRSDLEKKELELREAQMDRNRANEALVREREANRKRKRRGLLG